MRTKPDGRSLTQEPLAGPLATRAHRGRDLPQWQLDVSSAGRVWYVIDAATHTVWVTLASTGHPGATDAGKGSGRHTSTTR